MDQSDYVSFLEQVLTPYRLSHSLGVMQVMGELAEIYHLDRDQALTAGLLHDAAKDLPLEKQTLLIQAGNFQINHEYEANFYTYLHGPVGAFFVQKELGIDDPLILNAIADHTYSRTSPDFNHPLSWCVRFADFLEPTRNWSKEKTILNCMGRLRELSYAGEVGPAAFLLTGHLLKWFEEKNIPLHPQMRMTHKTLAKELNLDDTFLQIDH